MLWSGGGHWGLRRQRMIRIVCDCRRRCREKFFHGMPPPGLGWALITMVTSEMDSRDSPGLEYPVQCGSISIYNGTITTTRFMRE